MRNSMARRQEWAAITLTAKHCCHRSSIWVNFARLMYEIGNNIQSKIVGQPCMDGVMDNESEHCSRLYFYIAIPINGIWDDWIFPEKMIFSRIAIGECVPDPMAKLIESQRHLSRTNHLKSPLNLSRYLHIFITTQSTHLLNWVFFDTNIIYFCRFQNIGWSDFPLVSTSTLVPITKKWLWRSIYNHSIREQFSLTFALKPLFENIQHFGMFLYFDS